MVISAAAPDRPHGDPVAGGVIDDCESPAAGEKAAPPTGGDHALTVEAEEARSAPPPTVLDEPTVAELLTKVGDQVRAAVANPPPPVELPVELPLRRPVAEDDLAFPPFLVRASA